MIHPRSASEGRSSNFASTAVQTTLAFADRPGSPEPSSRGTLTLSPSLLLDLQRVAEAPEAADLLAVCAASVRHTKPLAVSVELGGEAYNLALDPVRAVFHCAVDLCGVPDQVFSSLRLLSVHPGPLDEAQRAALRPGSLRPMLWHLALRGPMTELLPEIAGPIRCRVALGTPLGGLPLDGSRKRLIDRMKSAPVSVDDLASSCGLSRTAVHRVWNALYLQSALMITRPTRGS